MDTSQRFFDLPISVVSGSVCNALRIMYHGSLDGAFGQSLHERVDLDKIQAIKIHLPYRPADGKPAEYEYNLVFYRRDMAASIWDPECRDRQAELMKLTRRVFLNGEKEPFSQRVVRRFFDRAERPIHFARYQDTVPADHYVPLAYHRQLFLDFVPYIMRTRPDYPLVRSLFQAQALDMAERKLVGHAAGDDPPVVTYRLKGAEVQAAKAPRGSRREAMAG